MRVLATQTLVSIHARFADVGRMTGVRPTSRCAYSIHLSYLMICLARAAGEPTNRPEAQPLRMRFRQALAHIN
jgi:hypothetical protein